MATLQAVRACRAHSRLISARLLSTTATVQQPFFASGLADNGHDILNDVLTSRPSAAGFTPPRPRSNAPPKLKSVTKGSRQDVSQPLQYRLHISASRNNTIITLTRPDGNRPVNGQVSSGILKFKKVQRSTNEAGFQCAITAIKRIEEELKAIGEEYSIVETHMSPRPGKIGLLTPGMQVELIFNGFGQGRDAFHQALVTTEGQRVRPLINRITDKTPIKVGGTRSKKARRL